MMSVRVASQRRAADTSNDRDDAAIILQDAFIVGYRRCAEEVCRHLDTVLGAANNIINQTGSGGVKSDANGLRERLLRHLDVRCHSAESSKSMTTTTISCQANAFLEHLPSPGTCTSVARQPAAWSQITSQTTPALVGLSVVTGVGKHNDVIYLVDKDGIPTRGTVVMATVAVTGGCHHLPAEPLESIRTTAILDFDSYRATVAAASRPVAATNAAKPSGAVRADDVILTSLACTRRPSREIVARLTTASTSSGTRTINDGCSDVRCRPLVIAIGDQDLDRPALLATGERPFYVTSRTANTATGAALPPQMKKAAAKLENSTNVYADAVAPSSWRPWRF